MDTPAQGERENCPFLCLFSIPGRTDQRMPVHVGRCESEIPAETPAQTLVFSGQRCGDGLGVQWVSHHILSLFGGPEPWVWASGIKVPGSLLGAPHRSPPRVSSRLAKTPGLGVRRCAGGDGLVRVCSSLGQRPPSPGPTLSPSRAPPVSDKAAGSPVSSTPAASPSFQADWATVLPLVVIRGRPSAFPGCLHLPCPSFCAPRPLLPKPRLFP